MNSFLQINHHPPTTNIISETFVNQFCLEGYDEQETVGTNEEKERMTNRKRKQSPNSHVAARRRRRSTKPPLTSSSKKYYAVLKGRNGIPCIYPSWEECQQQVHGFRGAIYKSFSSYAEAQNFVSPNAITNAPLTAVTTTHATGDNGVFTTDSNRTSSNGSDNNNNNQINVRQNEHHDTKMTIAIETTTTNTKSHIQIVHRNAHAGTDAETTTITISTDRRPTHPDATTAWVMKQPTVVNNSNNHINTIYDGNHTNDDDSINNDAARALSTIPPHPPPPTSRTTPYHYHIQITFDGGSRGNPGPIAGAGAVVTLLQQQQQQEDSSASPRTTVRTYHVRHYLGIDSIHPHRKVTSNQAEYNGIVTALRVAWNCIQQQQQQQQRRLLHDDDSVIVMVLDSLFIQGDSQLVINQLNGTCKCKSANLQTLFNLSQQLLQRLKSVNTTSSSSSSLPQPSITMEHIKRHRNKQADGMSLLLLDLLHTVVSCFFFGDSVPPHRI
jgi:ribonuclease HI